jgi:hypothetical protein
MGITCSRGVPRSSGVAGTLNASPCQRSHLGPLPGTFALYTVIRAVKPIYSDVISRHSPAGRARWTLEATNLSPWCRLPGSPLFGPFFVVPDHPSAPRPLVRFGPASVGHNVDSFTFFVSHPGSTGSKNTITGDLGILDAAGRYFRHSSVSVSNGESQRVTPSVRPRTFDSVYFTLSVSLAALVDASAYGGIEISYIGGYKTNPLVELFNEFGSDKGT